MVGYKLTLEQKESIQGVFYNSECFFECVKDINNDWFLILSDYDKQQIESTQYAYLLSLSEFEYVPPIIENPFI